MVYIRRTRTLLQSDANLRWRPRVWELHQWYVVKWNSRWVIFQFHISSGEVSCKKFCGRAGLCQGVILHTEASQSVEICQEICTDYDGCNFYSFDPESEQCRLFDSCQTSDLWVRRYSVPRQDLSVNFRVAILWGHPFTNSLNWIQTDILRGLHQWKPRLHIWGGGRWWGGKVINFN